MKNVVLIGMPGTGKSVVGRALAEQLDYTFEDLDDLIVRAAGKTLPQILRQDGLDAFFRVEEQVGRTFDRQNTVAATGGSMVLYEQAMDHLHQNGVIVWLETPLSQISDRMPADLVDRGIAGAGGNDAASDIRTAPAALRKYADLIVVSGTAR